jgi:hypothetical protein
MFCKGRPNLLSGASAELGSVILLGQFSFERCDLLLSFGERSRGAADLHAARQPQLRSPRSSRFWQCELPACISCCSRSRLV